ncbi:MAG TPA: T9SS type A sorting domain-containing protein [Bacteroidia bacterium]|nr:T9SS type A sorting domain-containing protein [Bacteroidia bacterium]
MKRIYFLFCILFLKSTIAQEVLVDHWLGVQTYTPSSFTRDYNVSTIVNNKIITVVDTLPNGPYNLSGLYTYDINNRATGNINFTLAPGDRGIKCATNYKTSTPGLEYGIFGCYSTVNAGESYPVVYTYNSQSGLVTADSIQEGTQNLYDGGIQKIIMYSPSTNNDTMRVFCIYNSGLSIFSKQINQPTFSLSGSVPVNIDFINACYVFNNTLYIGGMYMDQPCLLESIDGRSFTPVAGFNGGSFPQYSCINNIISYNNQLYYSINLSGNDFYIYRYSAPSHILVQSSGGFESAKSMAVYKNRLFISTSKSAMSFLANIYVLDGPGNVDTSANQFGYEDVDGNYMELITNGDSLFFIGNKGTFQASKNSSQGSASTLMLLNKYINIAKLNAPIASFNYNNNNICLNSTETFSSTSQYTDSLHWLLDGSYYSSSPGPSAWMNINFPTIGNHNVGLVAFGGNLTDTTTLSVNVYDINVSIAATRTLVCYTSTVSGTSVLTSTVNGGIGAITYDWKQIYPPIVSVGSGSSYTFNPTSWGTPYGFFLVATDIHGCSVTSNTISISSNPLRDVEFYALSGSSPTFTPVSGNVVLYKYESTLGKFDSISYLPTNGIGYNFFPTLDEGEYILQAIPSASSLQISYYGNNATMWKDAIPFTHTCINSRIDTINVIPLTSIGGGPCELRGTIYEDVGFVPKSPNDGFKPLVPGTPIGGIVVKGGKNPGGQMFSQTITTDSNSPTPGEYVFSNLPYGDYFILVDIPGLDTNGTYHVTLSASTPSVTNLNFYVDSIYINPVGSVTSVLSQESNLFENKIVLFPNPAKEMVFLEYQLMEEAAIKIELYDIVGRKTKTVLNETKQTKNKYKHTISLDELNSGVYFLKVKINEGETIIKFIITN